MATSSSAKWRPWRCPFSGKRAPTEGRVPQLFACSYTPRHGAPGKSDFSVRWHAHGKLVLGTLGDSVVALGFRSCRRSSPCLWFHGKSTESSSSILDPRGSCSRRSDGFCLWKNTKGARHSRPSLTLSVVAKQLSRASLRSLNWNLHPPTAFCFAKHALFLLPYSSISMDVRHDILELARFLTELSVIDYYFVSHRQSSVGLAALLFAMDESPALPEQVRKEFLAEMGKVAHLDPDSAPVHDCRDRLQLLYDQGGYSRMVTTAVVTPETRAETVSPVCVTYGCVPAHMSAPTRHSSSSTISPTASSSSDDTPSDHPLVNSSANKATHF